MKQITNTTADRDSLDHKLKQLGVSVRTSLETVQNSTRQGAYYQIIVGLTNTWFFIGLGRNTPNEVWREIVERVG